MQQSALTDDPITPIENKDAGVFWSVMILEIETLSQKQVALLLYKQ